jgi:hypothetical protein
VRAFTCDVCGKLLFAENSVCVACGTPQGFSLGAMRFLPVDPATGRTTAADAVQCADLRLNGCNWLLDDGHASGRCGSCRLTRTRPNDADVDGLRAWAVAETAKRRLVYQLHDLSLPVVPLSDDARGLAFDLLSSADEPVTTGHACGVVTIDLAEGQDAHREAMRVTMGEPYRTLLGHLRHEVGHYYWQVLVDGNGLLGDAADPTALQRFRELFGDERADYAAALQEHYAGGAPADWQTRHVSAYATAHAWEDWAETFAHYLHIRDTLQTAAAYGMVVTGPETTTAPEAAELVALPAADAGDDQAIGSLVSTWLALTYALNAVNRSMGKGDLYPFVLTPLVITKLGFVHDVVVAAVRRPTPTSPCTSE